MYRPNRQDKLVAASALRHFDITDYPLNLEWVFSQAFVDLDLHLQNVTRTKWCCIESSFRMVRPVDLGAVSDPIPDSIKGGAIVGLRHIISRVMSLQRTNHIRCVTHRL